MIKKIKMNIASSSVLHLDAVRTQTWQSHMLTVCHEHASCDALGVTRVSHAALPANTGAGPETWTRRDLVISARGGEDIGQSKEDAPPLWLCIQMDW